jgi:Protein of unknown function (DUF3306)
MTDREAFLARWSRRKREAAAIPPAPAAEEPAAPATQSGNPESASAAPAAQSQPKSNSELPPIDAIDGGTDIRAFLQEGVPRDLARAALRRAWSSDPAIRDFIGLSENAWDFTAPEGVPGFGPFNPDAARQLVAQVFGDSDATSGAASAVAAAAEPEPAASSGAGVEHEDSSAQQSPGAQAQPRADASAAAQSDPATEDAAVQQQAAGPQPPPRASG